MAFQFSRQAPVKVHGRAPGQFSPNTNYHPQSGGSSPMQSALPGPPEPQPYTLMPRQQLLEDEGRGNVDAAAAPPAAGRAISPLQAKQTRTQQYGEATDEDHRDFRRELSRMSPGRVGGSGEVPAGRGGGAGAATTSRASSRERRVVVGTSSPDPYRVGLSSGKDFESAQDARIRQKLESMGTQLAKDEEKIAELSSDVAELKHNTNSRRSSPIPSRGTTHSHHHGSGAGGGVGGGGLSYSDAEILSIRARLKIKEDEQVGQELLVHELRRELEVLRAKSDAHNSNAQEAEDEVIQLKTENAALVKKNSDLQSKYHKLHADYEDAASMADQMAKHIKHLTSQVESQRKEISRLNSANGRLIEGKSSTTAAGSSARVVAAGRGGAALSAQEEIEALDSEIEARERALTNPAGVSSGRAGSGSGSRRMSPHLAERGGDSPQRRSSHQAERAKMRFMKQQELKLIQEIADREGIDLEEAAAKLAAAEEQQYRKRQQEHDGVTTARGGAATRSPDSDDLSSIPAGGEGHHYYHKESGGGSPTLKPHTQQPGGDGLYPISGGSPSRQAAAAYSHHDPPPPQTQQQQQQHPIGTVKYDGRFPWDSAGRSSSNQPLPFDNSSSKPVVQQHYHHPVAPSPVEHHQHRVPDKSGNALAEFLRRNPTPHNTIGGGGGGGGAPGRDSGGFLGASSSHSGGGAPPAPHHHHHQPHLSGVVQQPGHVSPAAIDDLSAVEAGGVL